MELFYQKNGYKPNEGGTPKDNRVYFTSHPADFSNYFSPIIEDIFRTQNCIVFYKKDPYAVLSEEDLNELKNRIQLIVIPITNRFLLEDNLVKTLEFTYAMKEHIPVLPIMVESGLAEEFNRICGKLQFLDKYQLDLTAIPYEEKLKNYLESVLIGNELAEQIRQAFDAYIFISYRKKDRRYAQELIHMIHQNDFCRDIATWYDEYLTPGENFNEAIRAAMDKSKLFALVVTPNLVNEVNYVMTVEYPAAQDAAKQILPVEMTETNRNALENCYPNIPSVICAKDETALTGSLSQIFMQQVQRLAIAENDADPQHLFFIGLAYLNGIDVEVDRQRGIQILEQSANLNFSKAMVKLISIYENGEGTAVSYEKACFWYEKLCRCYEEQFGKESEATYFAIGKLSKAYLRLGKFNDALKVGEEMLSIGQKIFNEVSGDTARALANLSEVYTYLGDYEKALSFSEQAHQVFLQSEIKADEIAEANYLYRIASVFGSLQQFDRQADICEKVVEILKRQYGAEDPQTLNAYAEYSTVLGQMGDYERSISQLESLILKFEKVFGKTHPDTNLLKNNLSAIYQKANRFEDALQLIKKVYEERLSLLGPEQPGTIIAMSNLIASYLQLDQCEKAAELGEEAWKLRQKVFGARNINNVNFLVDLQMTYGFLKNGEKELEYAELAYSIGRETFGEHHNYMLKALYGIAEGYSRIGNHQVAKETYEKLVSLFDGNEDYLDANRVSALIDLSSENEQLKLYEEQLQAAKKAYALGCKLLGEYANNTLTALFEIALSYTNIGMPEKAIQTYQKLLTDCERSKTYSNVARINALLNLSKLYNKLGEPEQELLFAQKAYDFSVEKLGKVHPKTIEARCYAARVYENQNLSEDALTLWQQVYQYAKGVPEQEQYMWAAAVSIGDELCKIGQAKDSIPYYEEALNGYFKDEKDEPKLYYAAMALKKVYDDEDWESLLSLYRILYQVACRQGSKTPNAISMLQQIAILLYNTDQNEEAIQTQKQVIKETSEVFGETSKQLKAAQQLLEQIM